MRNYAILAATLLWLWMAAPVWAHANFIRSEPAANGVLSQSPAEIRLWFTEPLEPAFSQLELRDQTGTVVTTSTAMVDATDDHQLVLLLAPLADGLYTAVWQVVSAADGHASQGSFPFSVGVAGGATATPAPSPADDTLPMAATTVRWFNLLSLALLVGGLTFRLLVWRPAGFMDHPAGQRLDLILWISWLAVGVAGALVLRLQAIIATHAGFGAPLDQAVMEQIVTGTRFGALWITRMALWVVLGVVIVLGVRLSGLRWLALALSLALLLTTSLFSHGSATPDPWLAVLSDWFHLVLTGLWIGGLVSFLSMIGPLRRQGSSAAPSLAHLTAQFSNCARIAVAGLVVTGLYAAWLHVGTLEALQTTLYGQALLVKLALFLPLLLLAAVNLVFTQRRLQRGERVWAGWLQALVGAEVVLALALLAAVGVMTSIAPARQMVQARALAAQAAAAIPQPQPISKMQMADPLHLHLTITPGWTGENEFEIMLTDVDGAPVTDASLIRLRFDHQQEDLGRSELRIEEAQAPDGIYRVRGSNLSIPGDWRIRMTVQRPDQFDTVVDFEPTVPTMPAPPPPPPVAQATALPYRLPVLLLTGLVALALGGFFLGQQGFRVQQGAGLVATGMVIVGLAFLLSGVLALSA